jgi:hypothetical protein
VFEDVGGALALVAVVSWASDPRRGTGCGGVTGATALAHVRPWLAETAAKLGSPIGP